MLKREVALASGRGLSLKVSEKARRWLVAQNDHPEWGARPLRRIIQRNLREPLADFLLTADPPAGTVVHVDEGESGLTFDTQGQ